MGGGKKRKKRHITFGVFNFMNKGPNTHFWDILRKRNPASRKNKKTDIVLNRSKAGAAD